MCVKKADRQKKKQCICTAYVERLMGVEPTCRAWEARILPMNYSREKGMTQGSLASFLVGVTGLEPMASWSRTKRDTKLRHTPKCVRFRALWYYNIF